MRNVIILLIGIFVIVVMWFFIPVILVRLNVLYGLPIISNSYLKTFGIIIFTLGFSMTLYIMHEHLLTGRITPIAIEEPKKLIIKGFYAYTRNPMFIAVSMTFLGLFFIFGYILLLLYALLTIPAFHLFVLYKEEPELKKEFGRQYEEYQEKVPRWFPKFLGK